MPNPTYTGRAVNAITQAAAISMTSPDGWPTSSQRPRASSAPATRSPRAAPAPGGQPGRPARQGHRRPRRRVPARPGRGAEAHRRQGPGDARPLDYGETQRELADEFGVSPSTVSDIAAGRTWGWLA